MSQSLRPQLRHLMVVNRQQHQVGHRVLAVGRIRPQTCTNCCGERRVQAGPAGPSVPCPVCSLSAVDTKAVAR
ncbi:hypothetical protein ACIRPK_34135 [Kitasatospora sp. NPDC101801]|uniref:hypothetical protein n=1 Tax=Kitasatospora sp. NPDC101801 TaxID=3364103 RepID=UPI0038169299